MSAETSDSKLLWGMNIGLPISNRGIDQMTDSRIIAHPTSSLDVTFRDILDHLATDPPA
jgi:hypothetical protein